MRIVFMGSAPISCVSLRALCSGGEHPVVGVVTQPDRPKGRDLKTVACPPRQFAAERGIAVLSPENVNTAAAIASIRDLKPDLIVVVAYGQILKQEILDIPACGCINLHASLLPKYRGAAPIQWPIANGDPTTGVTIMFVERRMDAGDIILQEEAAIREDDTGGMIHDRLAEVGAKLLVKAVAAIAGGTATRTPQKEGEATYARKLSKQDGRIEWARPARESYNRIRAFNPWPGSFCTATGVGALKVLRARIESGAGDPGEVLEAAGEGPLVATADQALRLLEIQPEGRKAMAGSAFLNGHALKKGDRLT